MPGPQKLGERLLNWLRNLWIVKSAKDVWDRFIKWAGGMPTALDIQMATDLIYSPDPQARAVAEAYLKAKGEPPPPAITKFQQFKERLNENPSEVIAEVLKSSIDDPRLHEAVEVLGALMFDSVMAAALPDPNEPGTDTLERVRRFMGTVVAMSAAPKVMGAISEILSMGQIDTVGDVMRDAYFNLGLGFITWQMTSPLLEAGVGSRLKEYANTIYRPERFSLTQMMDLYALGLMSAGEVRSELARLGWRDSDIDKVIALSFKEPSEGTIFAAWHEGLKDEAWVASKLRAKGYDADTIQLLMMLNRPQDVAETKRVLISTLYKSFKEGLIGEGEFRSLMAQAGYAPEEVDLRVQLARLDQSEELRRLTKSEVEKAFKQNVIGEQEARHYLQEARFDDESINIMLQTWQAEKVPRVRQLNRSTIAQAYQLGLIDQKRAIDLLTEIGYSNRDALMIVEVAKAQLHEERKPPTVGAWMTALRQGIVTYDMFQQGLRDLGLSEAAIQLYAGIALVSPPEKAREISESKLLDLYRIAYFSHGETLQALMARGYGMRDAEAMVWHEAHSGTEAEVQDLYLRRRISRDEALYRLQAIKYTEREAEELITSWETEVGFIE